MRQQAHILFKKLHDREFTEKGYSNFVESFRLFFCDVQCFSSKKNDYHGKTRKFAEIINKKSTGLYYFFKFCKNHVKLLNEQHAGTSIDI